jgi:hypothetical protein
MTRLSFFARAFTESGLSWIDAGAFQAYIVLTLSRYPFLFASSALLTRF